MGEAFVEALEKTYYYAFTSLKMMGKMFIGKASTDNLSGPISIAQYAGQSAEMGLVHFLKFMALVSVSLGGLNLLPIPVLDGGHLMYYIIELVKGRPVSERVEAIGMRIGMSLVGVLMVVAIYNDIGRLIN
jgi:regulator of sigma E protease